MDSAVGGYINHEFLSANGIAPLEEGKDYVKFACLKEDAYLREILQRTLGKRVIFQVVDEEKMKSLLEDPVSIGLELEALAEDALDERKLENIAEEAPIVKFVNDTIKDAILRSATDIHIEQFENSVVVRYRIDGILYTIREYPKYIAPPVISRIKILSRLNIAEKRLPQDGKFSYSLNGQDYDIRVSTVPSVHGEGAVLRILKRGEINLSLHTLGFKERDVNTLLSFIKKPYGMILVTGPTGSGKTTTLYACMKEINTGEKKIITVEDPVEYNLRGVVQIQVMPKIGLTFANALRNILRQDPDVIMIGEIRDLETASIAVQASLTGHLVLATLHTNDSASAFTRLIDMGVEEFLLASAVVGVLSQRLVRKVCPYCMYEYQPAPFEEEILKLNGVEKPQKLYRGRGCEKCNNTGYSGRTVIGEVLSVTEGIRSLIVKKADAGKIREQAVREGMIPLLKDGLLKAVEGTTTVEEILRVYRD
ncbi:GspE/PulE family protein [Hydrogenobacter thermophilus]|uniref:GspE/PulE family protein n=1 Tax=Hydrogenobacter thermophilus TaxID=940 RepID=UPI0030F9061C